MLLSLEIENFKGVSARQRIEFGPITLLFGANSAGKSSALQALAYLHELLERGEADVDRTDLGGDSLALGGFSRLVHGHDGSLAIGLRVEFRTPRSLNRASRDLEGFPLPDLDDDIGRAWLEIRVQNWRSRYYEGPLVVAARIGLGDSLDPVLWLSLGASLRAGEPLYARINMGHPVFAGLEEAAKSEWLGVSLEERVERSVLSSSRDLLGGSLTDSIVFNGADFVEEQPLPVFAVSRSRPSALPALGEPIKVLLPSGEDPTPEEATALSEVRTFIEMVSLGTVAQLAETLRDTAYIGPLRRVPPRGFLFEQTGRVARWADGLAAWDLLLSDRTTLVEQCNDWLHRLGAGCKLTVQQLVDARASAEDLSLDHVDSTLRRLQLDTGGGTLVLPAEVGAGISQMIPVIVVSVYAGHHGTALIEQPEIHVHPALQVGLGDMFLEAAQKHGRQFIIETHSEHLLLRLMRRLRETCEGSLQAGSPPAEPDDIRIVFVERQPEGCLFRDMPLNERGDLVKAWPGGFFEEGLREVM